METDITGLFSGVYESIFGIIGVLYSALIELIATLVK